MTFKPKIGDIFLNKYEIVSLVGEGAFGAVYRARDIKLDRIVGMKFLRADGGVLERFSDELEAIKGLDHPNIVRLYDFDILKGAAPCIVMEFVNGREVGDILCDEGTFDLLRICEISMQVLDALVETHKQGIVHCDLKPENIMLTSVGARKDVVKLIDFGVASILSKTSDDRQKMLVGTPQYMAPEQIRHDEIGPWTDIYAMGLIMVELYTGQFVFDSEDPREVLRMQLYQQVEMPPQLENSVVGPIIRRAVEKDASKRYRSTQQFYDDIREATQILQTEARELRERKSGVHRGRAVSSMLDNVDDISNGPMSFSDGLSSMANSFNLNDGMRVPGLGRQAAGMNASQVPLLSKNEAADAAPIKSKPQMPAVSEDLGLGLDLSSLQSSIGDLADSNKSLKNPGRSVPPAESKPASSTPKQPAVEEKTPSTPNLSLSESSEELPGGLQRVQKTVNVVESNLTESTVKSGSNKKYVPVAQKKSHIGTVAAVSFILLLLVVGGYYVWRTGILSRVLGEYGISTPDVLNDDVPVAKPQPAAQAEPQKQVVRFSTIRDTATRMAYVSAFSGYAGILPVKKTLKTYRVIDTPVEGHIYANDSLVCTRTPCNVQIYGDPAKMKLEIRHKGQAGSVDLAKQDPSMPVILVLKK